MTSERVKRHVERLLDEADEAVVRADWTAVREKAQQILTLAPEDTDAVAFLAAAERGLGGPSAAPTPQATTA